jgi:restriction endonuclease S subunit
LKIKIELLSSQIAALDSMERKAEQDWLKDSTYRKKNYIILEEFQEAFMDRIKFAR